MIWQNWESKTILATRVSLPFIAQQSTNCYTRVAKCAYYKYANYFHFFLFRWMTHTKEWISTSWTQSKQNILRYIQTKGMSTRHVNKRIFNKAFLFYILYVYAYSIIHNFCSCFWINYYKLFDILYYWFVTGEWVIKIVNL